MCVKEGRPVPVGDQAAAEFVLGPVEKKKKKTARDKDRGCQRVKQSLLAGKDMLVQSGPWKMVSLKVSQKTIVF